MGCTEAPRKPFPSSQRGRRRAALGAPWESDAALKGQRCSSGAAMGKHGSFGAVSAGLRAAVVLPARPSRSSPCSLVGLEAFSAWVTKQNFPVNRSWWWGHITRSWWFSWIGKRCPTCCVGSLGLAWRGAGSGWIEEMVNSWVIFRKIWHYVLLGKNTSFQMLLIYPTSMEGWKSQRDFSSFSCQLMEWQLI